MGIAIFACSEVEQSGRPLASREHPVRLAPRREKRLMSGAASSVVLCG